MLLNNLRIYSSRSRASGVLFGGVIFSKATSGDMTVRDCLFTDCTLSKPNAGGSCIYTDGTSDIKIENCTFADNSVSYTSDSGKSSVIYSNSSNAKHYVKNCIFWGNIDKGGNPRATGKTANTVFEDCAADVSGLTGVTQISASPFKDAENGDYSLAKKVADNDNPCLGAGVKLDWMTAESKDLAGNPRLRGDDIVDLGCYEYFEAGARSGLLILVR